jgi:integrase
VPHLKVSGKGEKARYLPLHPGTNELIHDYLEAAGHGEEHPTGFTGSCGRIQHSSAANLNGALFRPVKNNTTGRPDTALKIGAHALRATAATNALESMVSRLDARVFPHESYRAAPCTKIAGVTIGISPNGLRARRSASSNTSSRHDR